MKPFVVANWKANENVKVLENLDTNQELVEVVITPPDIYIDEIRSKVKSHIKIGSQDCSRFNEGPYTGETPATLLKKKGVEYVIIGHCERRKYFNEDNEILAMKVRQALEAGLQVILCIGENRVDKETDNYMNVLYNQFFSVVGKDISIDIAYEPVWSIGTGITPNPKDIAETMRNIRKWCEGINVTGRILYGGSVSKKNICDFINIAGCDGVLLGSTSLVDDLQEIIKKIEDSVRTNSKQE